MIKTEILTTGQLLLLRESEDKVEFKSARGGNFSYDGGSRVAPKERRRCILGYVIAFANEMGGKLVLGVSEGQPHRVVGTEQCTGKLGQLESDIYNDTGIRVRIDELFEEKTNLRVLVITIPPRPRGKVYKFEGVALMRIGEELREMADAQIMKIWQEVEPDFSEQICPCIDMDDLDEEAVQLLRKSYFQKSGNALLLAISTEQLLNDLQLRIDGKLTNAAVLLLCKREKIKAQIPQAGVQWEFRNVPQQISFDQRESLIEPFFKAIEVLWSRINDRNGLVPVQEGPYIFDIPFFNQEVIREAITNAFVHRDYFRQSEIMIKQSPHELIVVNPGGFPPGVTIENILTVNSTPRNRLLADVLLKSGIVERSGQGVDKMFYQTLSEAKDAPDYFGTDDYQVELRLSAIVKDKAFALFIKHIQKNRKSDEMLGVHEVICLDKVREGNYILRDLDKKMVEKLLNVGLVERIGSTRASRLILSKDYFVFTNNRAAYTRLKPMNDAQIGIIISSLLQDHSYVKMGDFVRLFKKELGRESVKNMIYQLVAVGYLDKEGTGKGTKYKKGKAMLQGEEFMRRALELGLEEMRKRGELKTNFE
jgi:ATP-dependent DNA helicase RecG